MPTSAAKVAFDSVQALLHAFDTNQAMNDMLIDGIAREAWSATPPQPPATAGKKARITGRPISAIVAHMHNVRVMWLKALVRSKVQVSVPEQLDRDTLTPAEAKRALAESHKALRGVLEKSLTTDGRIPNFKPDAASFVGYLLAHDAHHRGQISMLARLGGHEIPKQLMFALWEWNR